MKTIIILVAFLIMAGCSSREIHGDTSRLSADQFAWLEKGIERDFSCVDNVKGVHVVQGKVVVRAQGEVIGCAPLVQAAKRGLVVSGCIVNDAENDTGYVIKGEINTNSFQEGRTSENRCVIEMSLVNDKSEVVYSQKYVVVNKYEQMKWK